MTYYYRGRLDATTAALPHTAAVPTIATKLPAAYYDSIRRRTHNIGMTDLYAKRTAVVSLYHTAAHIQGVRAPRLGSLHLFHLFPALITSSTLLGVGGGILL